jgi:hypothetical protein
MALSYLSLSSKSYFLAQDGVSTKVDYLVQLHRSFRARGKFDASSQSHCKKPRLRYADSCRELNFIRLCIVDTLYEN